MTFSRRSGSAWANLTSVKRRTGAAWVNVTSIKRRMSGAWVTVWTLVHAVACNPASINASRANGSGTFGVTATVSGGIGPFTYAWVWVSGGAVMPLSNTTSASVTISTSGTNTLREGTLRVTVTDTGNAGAVVTRDVPVAIQFGTPL